MGFGAHRPQLPALLPPQYRHPDLPLDPPQHEGPPGRPQREPFPPAFVPDLLESDRPGPRRPVRPGHDSFPAGLRQPDGAVPLRGERYEHPPSGGAAQGRHGRSDPFVDVHSAGVQTHENRHDATLRRRHLRQLPLGTPRQGVPSRFPDRQQMHVGKQRHHGEQFARRSSLLAGHEQDQLRHAQRTQPDDQPGRQCQHARFQQRRLDHRSGLPRRTGPDSGPAGENPPHRHARRDPHQAGGFPRKVSPDHLRRLRVRRTHPCTNGLCTRRHAAGRHLRRTAAADEFPRIPRRLLLRHRQRRIFGRISRIPVRPAAGTVFGQAEDVRTRKPPVPDRRQHLLDGFQPGIHRFRLPHDPPRVAMGFRRYLHRPDLCDRFAGRAHGLLPLETLLARLFLQFRSPEPAARQLRQPHADR